MAGSHSSKMCGSRALLRRVETWAQIPSGATASDRVASHT